MSKHSANGKPSDPRLLEIHTAAAWFFVEDAADIGRVKFFVGKQTATGNLTQQFWLDIDECRLLAYRILERERERVFWSLKGSGNKCRILRAGAENEECVFKFGEGPGVRLYGDHGPIEPDKTKKDEFVWIRIYLDRDQADKLGLFLRDWCAGLAVCEAFTTYQGQRTVEA